MAARPDLVRYRKDDVIHVAGLVSVRLGGTTLYETDRSRLNESIAYVESLLKGALNRHAMLMDRKTLYAAVKSVYSTPIDQRLMGAVLGRLLSCGNAIALPCLSLKGSVFRVFSCASYEATISGWCNTVSRMLESCDALAVRTAQRTLFPAMQWGSWSSASYVLQHLAWVGRAICVGDKLFSWPRDAHDAVMRAS